MMMWTVDEDTDAGNAVALVIEIRLDGDFMGGPVLSVIGKPDVVAV